MLRSVGRDTVCTIAAVLQARFAIERECGRIEVRRTNKGECMAAA
jgi:hypothetical protein